MIYIKIETYGLAYKSIHTAKLIIEEHILSHRTVGTSCVVRVELYVCTYIISRLTIKGVCAVGKGSTCDPGNDRPPPCCSGIGAGSEKGIECR